jgi:hypothetical protein
VTVIAFAPHYDKRATHRIVSDPSVLDIANDIDADAQEAISLAHNAHFMALGTGNDALVRVIQRLGSKVTHIRVLTHAGLDLYAESVAVDPYLALSLVPDDAA